MLNRFLNELRRRRVPQVAGFYLAAAWIAFEVAAATFPRLGIPDSAVTFVLIALLIGLPLVTGLAWAFDITPEGIRRTSAASLSDGEGTESAPDGRRRVAIAWIAIAAGVGAVAIATGAFFLLAGGDTEVAIEPNAIIVLPFTVRGGSEAAVLSEGLVEALSTKLDGVGGLRSVDPNTVLNRVSSSPEPGQARDFARSLGAGHYVLGSVLEFGGNLRIQASIHWTDDSRAPIEESVEGPESTLLALLDDLTAKLLLGGGLAPPGRLPRIAAMTTENLAAQKLFWEGEHEFREGRWDAAIERLERAVEVDSTFALAWYRMSVAASWAERPDLLFRALDAARRHLDRLGDRDRLLIEAYDARQHGRNAVAMRRYQAYLASYPDDVEAWYELGEVVSHWGVYLGIPLSETGAPFEHAVALDPAHVPALHHLADIATWSDDTVALDTLIKALRDLQGANLPGEVESEWVFTFGDSAAQARQTEWILSTQSIIGLVYAAWSIRESYTLERLLDTAIELPATRFDWIAPSFLAGFGRRDAALAWLERREAEGPPLRTALLAVQPFLRTPNARLESLRERIAAWDAGPVRTEPVGYSERDALEPAHPQLRMYVLGLIDARLGRRDAALRAADELDRMGGAEEIRTLAADLALHIRARVRLDEGNAAEALAIIVRASFWDTIVWDNRTSIVYAYAGPVLLRADAHLAVGETAEALRWYATFNLSPSVLGWSVYRDGVARETLGQADSAATRYAAFIRRWENADPELQEFVDDARRRLEALVERN